MPLHFTLASGRVLLLKEALSPEELAAAQTPAGMALLESVADRIAARTTHSLDPPILPTIACSLSMA